MAQIYVLDANVFIEAARRYYAFDLVPGYWRALIDHGASGQICSIDRVKDELLRNNDDLAEWAKREFARWFASTAEERVLAAYRQIMAWTQQQNQFTDAAKAEFARVADGWLVAYAKVYGYTLVTHEQFEPYVRRRVKIPNVCRALGVPTIDTFAMLRDLGVRLG